MISERQVKMYCADDIRLIQNYNKAAADTTQTWVCHHKLELRNGRMLSAKTLHKRGLYYKRPADEFVFLTRQVHQALHRIWRFTPICMRGLLDRFTEQAYRLGGTRR